MGKMQALMNMQAIRSCWTTSRHTWHRCRYGPARLRSHATATAVHDDVAVTAEHDDAAVTAAVPAGPVRHASIAVVLPGTSIADIPAAKFCDELMKIDSEELSGYIY